MPCYHRAGARQHERAGKGVQADPGNHLLQSVLFNIFINDLNKETKDPQQMLWKSIARRSKQVMIHLYSALVMQHLKDYVQIWTPHCQKDGACQEEGNRAGYESAAQVL